ncbi:MAG: histidinol-phosphate transaminase [Acetanaerobacterium sp.]
MIKGIRKYAYACEAYVAGKSMEDVKEEYGLNDIIKLGSNENAYGPYENASRMMREEIQRLNLYPENNFIRLKRLLGARFGVTAEHIGIGHGAGGVLDTIAKTFLEEGDEVLVPMQSYRLYREISKIMGATVKEISLDSDYTIDLDAYKAAMNDRVKLVWLCNPNNPTGTLFDNKKFEELVDALPENAWIVLDEAYAEFTDPKLLPDSIGYIKNHRKVISVHTFSKYYGLAGGRIGYMIADPEVITCYDTVSEPFNANRVGLAGAVATLESDGDNSKKYGDKMIEDREHMKTALSEMGCTVIASHANFVFFSTPFEGGAIGEWLLKKGIIVRPCGGWGYSHHIRVSIGNTSENELFLQEIGNALRHFAK